MGFFGWYSGNGIFPDDIRETLVYACWKCYVTRFLSWVLGPVLFCCKNYFNYSYVKLKRVHLWKHSSRSRTFQWHFSHFTGKTIFVPSARWVYGITGFSRILSRATRDRFRAVFVWFSYHEKTWRRWQLFARIAPCAHIARLFKTTTGRFLCLR